MLNSTFNPELPFRKREHEFVEEFCDFNLGHPISHWSSRPRSPQLSFHLLLHFHLSIFIRASTSCHVSFQHSPIVRLSPSHWISLMRSAVANFSHAFDRDLVDQDPPDKHVPFRVLDLTLQEPPRSLRNDKRSLVPH